MATALENLTVARDNLAARLAEITANPKPDYSVDGQQISWAAYQTMIIQQMEGLEKARQIVSGAFETRTRMF